MTDGRASRERPEPASQPDPAMVPFAVAGLVIWGVIGLALLPFHTRLAAAGHGGWLWTCLAGFLLGIPGLLVMIRHDAGRSSSRR